MIGALYNILIVGRLPMEIIRLMKIWVSRLGEDDYSLRSGGIGGNRLQDYTASQSPCLTGAERSC
jgi:hypothetical protein